MTWMLWREGLRHVSGASGSREEQAKYDENGPSKTRHAARSNKVRLRLIARLIIIF